MGKFSDYGGLEIFCKFLDFFFFSFYITAVQDDSSEGGIATVFEVLYCHCDVGSGMDRHVFTGSDDEYFVCIAFSHWHGKSAADNISQDIVEDNVRLIDIISSCFFEFFEGCDNASAGTAESWCRSACFNADHTLIADCGHVFQAEVLFFVIV